MSRRHPNDPFPTQDRYLRLQPPIHHDPLETMLAQREAQHQAAIEAINNGHTPMADPTDLRGIPVIAHGTGGTSPGTQPEAALIANEARSVRTPYVHS
jgi:hypothetical protein